MKRFVCIIPIFLSALFTMTGQEKVTGTVYEATEVGTANPLSGANVFWAGTAIGTITDFNGHFEIPFQKKNKGLVISYIGFKTDTLMVPGPTELKHWLLAENTLNAVVIENRKPTSFKSYLQVQNITHISSTELLKAACCNLAESFETNPAIDVNYPDAITGNRQIKMLGLTSPYTLMTLENIPAIRGAAQFYGLSFIPGTWVESLQISKGAGSVVHGFESIAGQINVELQKPATDVPFFLNAYAGSDGRLELNNHLNFQLNNKWHTGFYTHGNLRDTKMDNNNDGFLDNPLAGQLNLMNRWQYTDPEKGWVGFLDLRALTDTKQIGQMDFNPAADKFTTNAWGGEIETTRAEASVKIGYVFPDTPYQSLGFQSTFSHHEQESYFGFNVYNIRHESFFAKGMFSSIIGDSRHHFKTGLSFAHDRYDELVLAQNYGRTETSTGVFFEYAYDNLSDLLLTVGLRADHHNLIGTFVTPRLHVRYTPWEKSAIKISAGRGVRSPTIFAENQQLFASARTISILGEGSAFYGLEAEDAWNYGISIVQGFTLLGRNADVSLDFYRTDFKNQIVVDWEDFQQVRLYNLDGESFANTFQSEFNYSLAEHFNVRLSYRLVDVQTDYLEGRLQKPLTAKHRFFTNLGYQTHLTEKNTRWKLDATYNWLGKQRFPSTMTNPVEFRRGADTPDLHTLNAQLTRVFSPKFEMYVGGENITNTRQNHPIISSENPFSGYFDTTLVYGPVFGSMYYVGLRWKL